MHTILFQLLVKFLWNCCFFAVFSWARFHFLTHKTKLQTVNSYHITLFAQICLLWVEWLIYLTVGFFLRHVLRLSVFCILHILDWRSHRRHRRPGLALRLHGGPAGRRHRHHLRGAGHQCAGYVVVVRNKGNRVSVNNVIIYQRLQGYIVSQKLFIFLIVAFHCCNTIQIATMKIPNYGCTRKLFIWTGCI